MSMIMNEWKKAELSDAGNVRMQCRIHTFVRPRCPTAGAESRGRGPKSGLASGARPRVVGPAGRNGRGRLWFQPGEHKTRRLELGQSPQRTARQRNEAPHQRAGLAARRPGWHELRGLWSRKRVGPPGRKGPCSCSCSLQRGSRGRRTFAMGESASQCWPALHRPSGLDTGVRSSLCAQSKRACARRMLGPGGAAGWGGFRGSPGSDCSKVRAMLRSTAREAPLGSRSGVAGHQGAHPWPAKSIRCPHPVSRGGGWLPRQD